MHAKRSAPMGLNELPGHYIRRLQQIGVGIFMEETSAFGLTPVQYSALAAVQRQPGMDQRTLAGAIGFDTSTIGGVIDRLEARGLMQRNASPQDRRVRLLTLTDEARELLQQIEPAVLKTQERILQPLSEADQQEFLRMLKALVEANNDASRAPSDQA